MNLRLGSANMYSLWKSSLICSKRHPQVHSFLHSAQALKLMIIGFQSYYLAQGHDVASTIATIEDFPAEKDLSDQD